MASSSKREGLVRNSTPEEDQEARYWFNDVRLCTPQSIQAVFFPIIENLVYYIQERCFYSFIVPDNFELRFQDTVGHKRKAYITGGKKYVVVLHGTHRCRFIYSEPFENRAIVYVIAYKSGDKFPVSFAENRLATLLLESNSSRGVIMMSAEGPNVFIEEDEVKIESQALNSILEVPENYLVNIITNKGTPENKLIYRSIEIVHNNNVPQPSLRLTDTPPMPEAKKLPAPLSSKSPKTMKKVSPQASTSSEQKIYGNNWFEELCDDGVYNHTFAGQIENDGFYSLLPHTFQIFKLKRGSNLVVQVANRNFTNSFTAKVRCGKEYLILCGEADQYNLTAVPSNNQQATEEVATINIIVPLQSASNYTIPMRLIRPVSFIAVNDRKYDFVIIPQNLSSSMAPGSTFKGRTYIIEANHAPVKMVELEALRLHLRVKNWQPGNAVHLHFIT